MPGYLIVQISVTDPETYARYREQVAATLDAFDGRFLVRGGATETLEGDWSPERLVVVEFPSVEQAKAWWSSAAYAEPKALRQSASVTQMIVAAGT